MPSRVEAVLQAILPSAIPPGRYNGKWSADHVYFSVPNLGDLVAITAVAIRGFDCPCVVVVTEKGVTIDETSPYKESAHVTPSRLILSNRQGDEIIPYQLNAPVPSWTLTRRRWNITYWICDMAYPVGNLWLFDAGESPNPTRHETLPAYVDWLHVMEEFRRRGIATELLKAATTWWPDLACDCTTSLGEKFLTNYRKKYQSAPPVPGGKVVDLKE